MSKPRRSSGSWRERQERDPYVQQARREGWRSRAVFKLKELDGKGSLLKPGRNVVDLGAAPGGWSQYASQRLKGQGRIVALDLLPIDPVDGVDVLQGDFTDEAVLAAVLDALRGDPVHLVLSDLAPNLSGSKAVDQPKAMYLAELAFDFAQKTLAARGAFVTKLFQGEGFDAFVADVRRGFEDVRVKKPAASRPGSREVYLVARNFRL